MDNERHRRLTWLANSLLACEAEVRAWLRRRMPGREDADDLIQEAYCRIWSALDARPIDNPRAYFYQTVRSIMVDRIRRSAVVNISAMADIEALPVLEEISSPERIVAARLDLKRVQALIEALPERRRRIMKLRKIDGLSQREIAEVMGVTEGIVENELVQGLKAILAGFEAGDGISAAGKPSTKAKRRERR
ncbi:MAG: RNA polymerase sigma factor [Phenylobacterium sp.]